MDNARLMSRMQCLSNRCTEFCGFTETESLTAHVILQIGTFDEVAHDVHRAVFAADFMDVHDVRMIHLSRRPCFTQKLCRLRVFQRTNTWNLDGYDSVKFRITCLSDAAEFPNAHFEQLKVGDCLRRAVIRSRGFSADQLEVTSTGGTFDVGQRIVAHDLNGVMAMRAATTHDELSPASVSNHTMIPKVIPRVREFLKDML